MGVVYVSRDGDEDRFTIGAAKSFTARKRGGYTRYNPRLKTYRLLSTPDHFALESYLHAELFGRRITDIQSQSWYAVTSEEMDAAIGRAETLGREHIARKKKVAELKRVSSNGEWLQPTQHIQELCARLNALTRQRQALALEEEQLRCEAMVCIGAADGIDGLIQWASESRQSFQPKEFKKQYPELHKAFSIDITVRKFKLWKGGTFVDEEASVE